jgi:DNA-binding NarL/FixJ family response regulator
MEPVTVGEWPMVAITRSAGIGNSMLARELLVSGEGRSVREIATLLALSVRTVDSHLAAVYLELGIAGRSDLADALEDREPC